MASLTDTRKTILEIFNEVRRKLGLKVVTSITADNQCKDMLQYLNDVIAEISDYGDWQEMLTEVLTTASSSVLNYSVNTEYVVKNIHEIVFENMIAAMRYVTLDDIRRLQRVGSTGVPNQYSIVGVDSVGNPNFRVYPTPGSSQKNQLCNVLFYKKPPLYTEADGSVIPEFPSRLIVQGLLARMLLDDSRGTPGVDWKVADDQFKEMLSETYNRFNGDTGSDTFMRPAYSRARR